MTTSIPEPGSGVEYRSEIDTYRAMFAHDTTPPSEVVVRAIATIRNCGVEALDPLYEAIEPTALDALFQPTVKGGHRGDGEVIFEYQGYEVNVKSCGEILIRSADQAD